MAFRELPKNPMKTFLEQLYAYAEATRERDVFQQAKTEMALISYVRDLIRRAEGA